MEVEERRRGNRGGGRRPGQKASRQLPYRHVLSDDGTRAYLECGHWFTRPGDWYPMPKRKAGCEACWMLAQLEGPNLRNYWFGKAGGRLYRAFRWGDLMYSDSLDRGAPAHFPKLILVRAETFAEAKRLARGMTPNYEAEGQRWRKLTRSRLRRGTARSD